MTLMIYGLLAAILGLSVSRYIYHKLQHQKPLMCPRNAPCEEVVNSTHATTFGISNTVLGQGYYAVMIAVFAALLAEALPAVFMHIAFGLSIGGFLFSLYLIGIQAFVLRKWCLWCLASALSSTVIFAAMLVLVQYS